MGTTTEIQRYAHVARWYARTRRFCWTYMFSENRQRHQVDEGIYQSWTWGLLHLTTFQKILRYYFVVSIMPDMDGTYFVPCLSQVFSTRGNMWHDQFIKITFMRYGHSAVGIIWVSLKSNALKTRDLTHHICCKIESDIRNMERTQKPISFRSLTKMRPRQGLRLMPWTGLGYRKNLILTCIHLIPKSIQHGWTLSTSVEQ